MTTALPHSADCERAVLAAALLDPPQLARIREQLSVEDFFGDRHQVIFGTMRELVEEGVTVDMLTLTARLEQRGELANVGGASYLSAMDLDLPDLGRVDQYVGIVRQHSIERRIVRAASELTKNALSGESRGVALAVRELTDLVVESQPRRSMTFGQAIRETLLELEADSTPHGRKHPRTGFGDLDSILQGVRGGRVYFVGGRPGMGKTTFALNIAGHLAIAQGVPSGVVSLEMSRKELVLKLLAAEAGIPAGCFERNSLSTEQWSMLLERERDLSKAPLFVDDECGGDLGSVSGAIRRWHHEHGLRVAFIDYLQLMSAGGRTENRNQELSTITRRIKLLARELDVAIFAITQLSRRNEHRGGDMRPQLSDARDSGAIEQDGDAAIFLHRPGYYDPEVDQSQTEALILKNRHGVTGGKVDLFFNGGLSRFQGVAHTTAPF